MDADGGMSAAPALWSPRRGAARQAAPVPQPGAFAGMTGRGLACVPPSSPSASVSASPWLLPSPSPSLPLSLSLSRKILRALALALAVALAGWILPGQAACDSGLAGRMNARLHPERAFDEERAACRSWPGQPGRSIVVLPLARAGAEPGATEFDLDVLVVQQADNGNTERSTIAARLFEPRVLLEDAVRIDDIRIDSGRYPLAPEVRAFGVRVRYSGTSRALPYASETLMLYAQQGDRLRRVLGGLEVAMERGEWDPGCHATFEQMRGALSLAPERSHGFADLLLRRTRITSRASFVDGDCIEQSAAPRFDTVLLRYDGSRYGAVAAAAARNR